MSRVYNFSAGPAVLPEEVLKEAESRIDEAYSDYVKWCRNEKPQSKEDAISGVIAWRDELAKLKGGETE